MFITIEGGEGAGKSTLLEAMASRLGDVVVTREPGGSSLSEGIRSLLLDPSLPIVPKAETLLFLAARAQHIAECIAPALLEGKTVVCDRFHDSTIAYQGYGRGLGAELISSLCDLVGEQKPDLTLLLDIDPEIGLKRAPSKDRMELEDLEFHKRVRTGFLKLAEQNPDRIKVLDAMKPLDEILEQALSYV